MTNLGKGMKVVLEGKGRYGEEGRQGRKEMA